MVELGWLKSEFRFENIFCVLDVYIFRFWWIFERLDRECYGKCEFFLMFLVVRYWFVVFKM